MGTPHFATEPLKALLNNNFEITAVVTAPDRATGRGLKTTPSDVKVFAESKGIPVLQPESLKESSFISALKQLDAEIFVVVAFRMLPEIVWSIPSKGTFNLHASLLPQYRGAAPINHAIINGETKTGVTTFMIDHNIDTGAILFQEECEIGEQETAGELHDKLMKIGASLVVKTAMAISEGNLTPTLQSSLLKSNDTLKTAPKLSKECGRIVWEKDCTDIYNLIRGLSPYPAAHSVLTAVDKTIPVKIFGSHPDLQHNTLKPGEIESDNKSYLRVGCKKGSLLLKSIQAAGKKRLSIREFLAGTRDIATFRFI